MVVLAILIVLSNHMTVSNAATESPKVQEPTSSDCGPQGCSGFKIITGPWGDNQTQNVQLNCKVNVTESQNPGEFSLLLSLDRDTEVVTPHNLQLSRSNRDGLQFTFTNEYIVPVSTFVFDFELSYSIDQGNAAIPDGNCSAGGGTTHTTTASPITSSSATSSASVSRSTTTAVSGKSQTSILSAVSTSPLASTHQTSTLQSSPADSGNTDEGNIFGRIVDGYVYSIVLVAGLSLAVIILLLVLVCCIYHYACRRRTGNRIFDEASNDRNRQESSAHRNLDRQNSASNLLAHQGCSSSDCYTLQLFNGPWGGSSLKYIKKQCYLEITATQSPGDLDVYLWLDREVESVTPHNLNHVSDLSDCSYSYTNVWDVHPGTYTFDMQLAYRVDEGNTAAPEGYCSLSAVPASCSSSTTTTAATTSSTTTTTAATTSSTTTTTTAATTSSTTTVAPTTTSTLTTTASTTPTTTTTASTTPTSTTTASTTPTSTTTALTTPTTTTTASTTPTSTTTTSTTPTSTTTTSTTPTSTTTASTTPTITTTVSTPTTTTTTSTTPTTTTASTTTPTTTTAPSKTTTTRKTITISTTTTAPTTTITYSSTQSISAVITQGVLQIVYVQCDGTGTINELLLNCKLYIIVLFASLVAGGILSVLLIRYCLKKRALRKQNPVKNRIGVDEYINNETKSTDSRLTSHANSRMGTKITTVHQIEHSEAWFYPTLGKLSKTKVHRIGDNVSTFV